MTEKAKAEDIWVALDTETTGITKDDFVLEIYAVAIDKKTLKPRNDHGAFHDIRPVLRGSGVYDRLQSNAFVLDMHTKNNLLTECLAAGELFNNATIEHAVLCMFSALGDWCEDLVGGSGARIRLVGNTVHFDWRMLVQERPDLQDIFSHRVVDVSTLRDVVGAWGLAELAKAEPAHRAKDDVESSLKQLAEIRDLLEEHRWKSVSFDEPGYDSWPPCDCDD